MYSAKARKCIGMLLYSWADTSTLFLIYTTCIHPHLQYTCQLWDHFASKGGQSLEAVQECICKVCLKMWDLDYNTMLQLLNLPQLSVHCDYRKVITVYNINVILSIILAC